MPRARDTLPLDAATGAAAAAAVAAGSPAIKKEKKKSKKSKSKKASPAVDEPDTSTAAATLVPPTSDAGAGASVAATPKGDDSDADDDEDEDHDARFATADLSDAESDTEGKKKLSKQALTEFNEKERNRGIIYMSRIPPYMKPMKVRHHMEQYGAVGKLFLRPEDSIIAKKRKKFGGNRKTNYVEGWVEFEDKRVARSVAGALNGNNVGGRKGSFHYDDLWTMLYLPKFKWHHLTERIAYDNAVRQKRLQADDAQVRRETNTYVEQVTRAKRNEARLKKGIKRTGEGEIAPPSRRIKMRKPIASQDD
eukprot:m.106774 g.106774  ORF g.106774 m.106774 type:complete len:308 (-) comp21111_c0_seq1:1153-2076(-)